MENEDVLIALVRQYASQYGITFSSAHLDDPRKKARLINLIQASLAGKRGAITDDDITI